MPISRADIFSAIRSAGLSGSAVCLHASLKSFGWVDGGADAVIDSFLDAGCTLIVPAFTYECEVPPPPGRTILRNGTGPGWTIDQSKAEGYDRNGSRVSREMGVIPARILGRPERVRGNHPLNSFAGLGPRAAEAIDAQSPLNVYGPLQRVYLLPPAYLILAGVGLTKATTVHFAEERAGRRLFRRWAKWADGTECEVEAGSCSEGFERLAPFARTVERRIAVGTSLWRIFPYKDFVDTIASVLRQDPSITHCENRDCPRCNDAVRGGPLL